MLKKYLREYKTFNRVCKIFENVLLYLMVYWLVSQLYVSHTLLDRNLPWLIVTVFILMMLTKAYTVMLKATIINKLKSEGYIEECKQQIVRYDTKGLESLSRKANYYDFKRGVYVKNGLQAMVIGVTTFNFSAVRVDDLLNISGVVGVDVKSVEVRYLKFIRHYQYLINDICKDLNRVEVKFLKRKGN